MNHPDHKENHLERWVDRLRSHVKHIQQKHKDTSMTVDASIDCRSKIEPRHVGKYERLQMRRRMTLNSEDAARKALKSRVGSIAWGFSPAAGLRHLDIGTDMDEGHDVLFDTVLGSPASAVLPPHNDAGRQAGQYCLDNRWGIERGGPGRLGKVEYDALTSLWRTKENSTSTAKQLLGRPDSTKHSEGPTVDTETDLKKSNSNLEPNKSL